MTEEKTFAVARGEVIHVNSVEYQDKSSYSATIKIFNEVKKCFISDEQKVQESPLTGQKES